MRELPPNRVIAKAIRYARREGFGYGFTVGALAVTFIRRLIEAWWP